MEEEIMRRVVTSLLLVPALLVVLSGTAMAASMQTNGQGLTHGGASLGFNAQSDLSGHLTYISHDETFKVWCKDYTHYGQHSSPDGVLRSKVDATCVDQNGATIYFEGYFIDRGEPGINDRARLYFSYDPAFASDPDNDPNAIVDKGIIQNGNIQIHP